MKIINFFGAPGSGKSILMLDGTSLLKKNRISAEIIPEYAKDLTFERADFKMMNQKYIFGKQQHRAWRVAEDCAVGVTDSPIMMSLYYGRNLSDAWKKTVMEEHAMYDSYNVWVKRAYDYEQVGRYQSEQQSDQLGVEMYGILKAAGLVFNKEIYGNHDGFMEVMNDLNSCGFLSKHIDVSVK